MLRFKSSIRKANRKILKEDEIMKKLIATILLFVLMTTQMPTATPVYAATTYDTKATKVASAKLSGVCWYDLSIKVGNKLVAKGTWERRSSPDKYTVQLQITKPVTYSGYDLGTDGTATLSEKTHIAVGGRWELESNIPVVRSTECAGDRNIELEIDLSGLTSGVYCLQEVVSQGSNSEGHYCDDTLLVMFNGIPSLQTTWIYADLTHWWHSIGWWID